MTRCEQNEEQMGVAGCEIRKDLKEDKSSEVRDEKRVKNKVEIQIKENSLIARSSVSELCN